MKVCILGDGLVSLALAKTLVNEGIFVDLIYNHKIKTINKTRTIGITKTNIDFFNKEILNISKLSWKINKIEIFLEKFKEKNIINFDNENEHLFSIIKNYKLYKLLNNNLKYSKYFKRKKKISGKFFKNEIYQIVINCEHDSSLTKKYFFKKIEKNYESMAYVSSIHHKKIVKNNIAYQVFTKFGPIAFLPISEFETSIVFSVKKKKILNEKIIIDLINKYNMKYSILKISKIDNFKLISSNLRTYNYENILAFGDLLHRVHPLAGQGFNMSIRDIQQLHLIIKNRLSLGLELDSSICSEFEKKVIHKNYLYSTGIDFIYEFFNVASRIENKQLGKIIKFFSKNKSLNKFFTKLADKGI